MSDINLEEIEKVLDQRVRPSLALHGGNIVISDLVDDVLKVRLTGGCANCMSAQSTVNDLVETEIRNAFPGIKRVKLVSGVSDTLLKEARKILKKRHE